MAQAGKIGLEARKRFAPQSTTRKVDVREARKYYLIVCEGAKTEPQYFEALVKDLPQPVAEVCRFDVVGGGRVTLSLVKHALALKADLEKAHTRSIDEVWVVFDYDDFADFNAAIEKCEAESTKECKVNAVWTNVAFELWFLLHFDYHDAALSRKQYEEKLSAAISTKSGKSFKYAKNDPDIYYLLKEYGDQTKATRFAKKLINNLWKGRKDYATHNPRTQVHDLLEALADLNEQLKAK